MPHSVLDKELGKLSLGTRDGKSSCCSRSHPAVLGSRGFWAGNVRVEKEPVTRVTVCVELLSRFSESSVPVSKGAG